MNCCRGLRSRRSQNGSASDESLSGQNRVDAGINLRSVEERTAQPRVSMIGSSANMYVPGDTGRSPAPEVVESDGVGRFHR